MSEDQTYPPRHEPIRRIRTPALIIGIVALVIAMLGAIPESGREAFFTSYLYAFLFWLGIALGSLALVFLHHLVGGNWGLAVRRPAEAAAMTLPLLLLLFIPILFGAKFLYPWAQWEIVADDPILQHQSALLNVGTAGGITIGIFLIWSLFAFWIVGWGLRYDRSQDRLLPRKMRK